MKAKMRSGTMTNGHPLNMSLLHKRLRSAREHKPFMHQFSKVPIIVKKYINNYAFFTECLLYNSSYIFANAVKILIYTPLWLLTVTCAV